MSAIISKDDTISAFTNSQGGESFYSEPWFVPVGSPEHPWASKVRIGLNAALLKFPVNLRKLIVDPHWENDAVAFYRANGELVFRLEIANNERHSIDRRTR